MRKTIAVGAGALSLALGGCGGGSHTTTTPTPSPPNHKVTIKQECPPGHAFMGCSKTGLPAQTFQRRLKALKSVPKGALKAPSGALFPDVSNWQGNVGWGSVGNWQRAHGWPQGGVFKMGEYLNRDSFAGNNARLLGSLHMWKSGYWFVRNVGCKEEANAIISASRDYGVKFVALDLEVGEASGYGKCLTPKLRAVGLAVNEYTSPGSNPGGVDTSAPLWEATFGSSFSAIWRPVVAWQCTDGVNGCVTNVPGIGFDDVSVDYGYSKLAIFGNQPPDPFVVLSKSIIVFGRIHTSEYGATKDFAKNHCTVKSKRSVCKRDITDLKLLTGRLWFIAHNRRDSHGKWHPTKVTWDTNHRGVRFHMMWVALHKTK